MYYFRRIVKEENKYTAANGNVKTGTAHDYTGLNHTNRYQIQLSSTQGTCRSSLSCQDRLM